MPRPRWVRRDWIPGCLLVSLGALPACTTLPTTPASPVIAVPVTSAAPETGGQVLWAHGFGDDRRQQLFGAAVTTDESVVLLGGGDFSGISQEEIKGPVLIGLSPRGDVRYAKSVVRSGGAWPLGIVPTKDGGTAMMGRSYVGDFGLGKLQRFDPGGTTGEKGLFVVHFDAKGNATHQQLWFARLVSPDPMIGRAPDGGALVVGAIDGSIDIEGLPQPAVLGDDAFAVRLAPDGKPLWLHMWSGKERQFAHTAVGVDKGDSIVAGGFFGELQTGDKTLPSRGRSDAFVTRLGPSGEVVWTRTFGGEGRDEIPAVTAAPDGRLFVIGGHDGKLEVGATSLPDPEGKWSQYLAALDAAGQPLWCKPLPGISGVRLEADPQGHVFLSGWTRGEGEIGEEPSGDPFKRAHPFVTKLDKDGKPLWTRHVTTGYIDAGGLASGTTSLPVFYGTFSRSPQLGGRQVEHPGRTKDEDFFVFRLGP